MFAAYLVVTAVAASASALAGVLTLAGNRSVAQTADRLRIPLSWRPRLGALLAVGAAGLVLGFALPSLGTAAAAGLVLYFVAAAGVHIRQRDRRPLAWINWAAFFVLSMAALAVGLIYHGPW